ncbi:MAG: transglycosylase SLT domain-containing protein [Candidatus Angelobacter sp.]
MLMLYAGLLAAVVVLASAVGVYVYAVRRSAARMAAQSERRRQRAVLDDFGDGAVWQMGQRATNAIESGMQADPMPNRRGFLRRMTVSLLIMIAARKPAISVAASGPRKALAWENGHPKRSAWSDELRRAIRAHRATLETAGDIEDFAPGYANLSAEDRVDVWATLFVAIVRFETGYNPNTVYHESAGIDSVGLLQVSYENEGYYGLERLDRKADSLKDPLVNIRCGVRIFSVLVSRDAVIASGTGSSSRGAAKYWSTLRTDGHLSEIQRIVRSFALSHRHADHVD